jgi:predicted XRE-type DNA-binding protein
MIKKHTVSEFDIQRLAQFVVEDSPSPDDIPELIGMFLENTAGIENLSQNEIEELITIIKSKVNDIQQTTRGDQ